MSKVSVTYNVRDFELARFELGLVVLTPQEFLTHISEWIVECPMRRFTLRLPETLFQRLELLADGEGVSLNQYLIYSLTQHAARAYRAHPVPKDEIARQHAQYDELIEALGTVSDSDFDTILAEGEPVEIAMQLDAELVARIEAKIAAAKK